jgi:hypothetical protein
VHGHEPGRHAGHPTATNDDRIRRPAAAWLVAYNHARWLSFNQDVAHSQADAAWDSAVRDQAAAVAVDLVGVN